MSTGNITTIEGILDDIAGRMEIVGDGTQEKSYMHVDDCIGAMILIYEKTRDHKG